VIFLFEVNRFKNITIVLMSLQMTQPAHWDADTTASYE
jgi:hypothetical protein